LKANAVSVLRRLRNIISSNIPRSDRPFEVDTDGPPGAPSPGGPEFGAPEPPPTPEPSDPGLAKAYANLEIPYGSDVKTARRAWKKMLKRYHPDIHHRDPEKRRVANELSAELTNACRKIEEALKGRES